jgi:hypothetical protein
MANALITPTIIAREALMQLENNLVMGAQVHREYKREFVKVGSTVNIRKPVKFDVTDGVTLVQQDVEEANTNVVVDQRKHVGWNFTTQDLTLTIEEYSERYIKPAMISLANKVDRDLCSLYASVPNWVGTPGQVVNSYADFSKGPQRLDEGAVPRDSRHAVLAPEDHWALAGSQTSLFFSGIGTPAYRQGSIGNIGGVDTFMDQNVRTHTVGVATGAPLINGASQNVAYSAVTQATYSQSLVTDGWTNSITGILLAGDVITIAGVNAVNPVPGETGTGKDDLGRLQQFVVLADANSGATTGPATLTISPPIITSGPFQTVSAAPADGAAITVLGTGGTGYTQNLVFHRNAFALVTVPLEMPDGVAFKARESHNGLSIRVLKDFDIINDKDIIRLDILYGKKGLYTDLATRMSGSA